MPSLERDGVSIFFEESGAGRPIVLGHSFLCDGSMWAPQLGPLAERARVVNVDLRGHGRSGPVRRPFTLYDVVDDVVAVLDRLGIERAVWAGLSVGGMVALRAALCAPDRVAALVLLDTHAGAERRLQRLRFEMLGLGASLLGVRPFLPLLLPLMFGRTTRQSNRRLVDDWSRRFATLHVPSIRRGLDAIVGRDSLLDRLAQIRVPSLVVVGTEDTSLPPACSEQIAARLPHASLVRIPGAGHLSALEQPEAVNAAILAFLDGLPSGS